MKQGRCFFELESSSEILKWGKTRKVNFYANQEQQQEEQQMEIFDDDDEEQLQLVKKKKKRKNPIHKKRKFHDDDASISNFKKPAKKKKKDTIDRWSKERHEAAELNMLKILKEKEAVFGKPILRAALREEARKVIGDTGLLDHLLKYMAGKVAPGGEERFMRRHNADGAMEYWLESSDLVNIRKEAGVHDPYWTPPPGWNPGDCPNQDPVCVAEFKQLKEEIQQIKRDMQELVLKRQEDDLGIVSVTTQSSCVTSTQNLENASADGLLLPLNLNLKEMYADLVSKKAKLEEMYADVMNRKVEIEDKMMEVSHSLSGSMEKHMQKLNASMEEPKNKPETVMGSTKAPSPATLSVTEKETKEVEQKQNKHILLTYRKAKARAGKSTTTKAKATVPEPEPEVEDRAAKIERLKSAFKICKPQQSFMWPNTVMSPQPQPQPQTKVIVPLENLLMVPTPSSVSSSTVPVKPLAERPLVTAASKPASHSLINLNEPPSSNITAISCGLGKEEEDHQMSQCQKEKILRQCSSSDSSTLWLALAIHNPTLDSNSTRG